MTVSELQAVLDKHGLKIDGWRGGAGKFRDLEIGVGAAAPLLAAIAAELGGNVSARVTSVSNADHADYGKRYVEVSSFWWDE